MAYSFISIKYDTKIFSTKLVRSAYNKSIGFKTNPLILTAVVHAVNSRLLHTLASRQTANNLNMHKLV